MRGLTTRRARTRLLRPLARAADGIAHNRERRRTIHRYRRVQCVLVADRSADSMGDA
jgi:hypothetical protein